MAEEIKLTKDMTILDVFKLVDRDKVNVTSEDAQGKRTTQKKRNPTLKALEKAGLTMDSPYSSLQNEDFLKNLGKVGSESNFTNLTTIEKAFKRTWNRRGEGAYPFKDVFGAGGIARDPDLKISKADQARKTRVFKEVPEAQISLKKIVEGISKIEDVETRAAVSFQSLVPLRPGEVHSLTVDDIDFETGRISEEFRRIHKIRNPVELPEVAMSILKAQRVKNKTGKLFLTSTAKMSSAVTKHVQPLFVDFEKAMGRKIAGSADIRKIVPSIIVSELGYKEEAKKIMGHASYDDIVTDLNDIQGRHYVSPIMGKVGSSPKMALASLQNMYATVLELETVNSLATEFNLKLPDLEEVGSIKIQIIPKGGDIAGDVRTNTTLTDEDLDLIEERKETRRAKLSADKSKFEAEQIRADIDKEKNWAELAEEREKNRESRVIEKLDEADYRKAERMKRDDTRRAQDTKDNLTELEKEKALLKEKMGNTRMFGKFLGAGALVYSSQFIKPDFTAALGANIEAQDSDDDSFEARMRRGASNVLGPNVAAGVEAGAKFLDPGIQMAAELGPDAVKETLGASTVADATLNNDPLAQIKTGDQIRAGQQVMQDKADQQQYRGEVSPQVDDELAIQKQMNIKKQSEDFGREAEKKSQLTLEQQIETLLQEKQGGANYAQQ